MIGFLKRLRRSESGNVLILTGAAIPLLVGSAGLAVDTIQWTLWKRQLQRAADSAALAGVYQSVQGGNLQNVQATVTRDLSFNQNTGIALNSAYPQVAMLGNSSDGRMRNRVQVTLGIRKPLTFSSMFMAEAPLITATATAASVPGLGNPCVLALNRSASGTPLLITGSSDIEMRQCWAHSNGRSSNAAAGKGAGNLIAEGVSSSGGIQQSRNWAVDQYQPYIPEVDDPYASVKPKQEDLDNKCPSGSGNALDKQSDVNALDNSGVYCFSSLRVGASESMTLKPGTYYINGGDAFIQGDLTGDGVTIVLTNKSTSSTATIGQFKVNSGSKINLTAPKGGCDIGTDGCFKGIAIYQDRRAPTSNQSNKVNGNSGSIITGAMYFPKQMLDYNGTGTTNAVCTRFVAFEVTFSGNSTTSNKIKKDCEAFGLSDFDGPRRVRLVG